MALTVNRVNIENILENVLEYEVIQKEATYIDIAPVFTV